MLLTKKTPGGRGLTTGSGSFYDWTGPEPVDVLDVDARILLDEDPDEFAPADPTVVLPPQRLVTSDATDLPAVQPDRVTEQLLEQEPLTAVDLGTEPTSTDVADLPAEPAPAEPESPALEAPVLEDHGDVPAAVDAEVLEPAPLEPEPAAEPLPELPPIPDDGATTVTADNALEA